MYDIPETGFLRLPQVLSVIPLGKTSWWQGVKSGRLPQTRQTIGAMHRLAGRRHSGFDQKPHRAIASPLALKLQYNEFLSMPGEPAWS